MVIFVPNLTQFSQKNLIILISRIIAQMSYERNLENNSGALNLRPVVYIHIWRFLLWYVAYIQFFISLLCMMDIMESWVFIISQHIFVWKVKISVGIFSEWFSLAVKIIVIKMSSQICRKFLHLHLRAIVSYISRRLDIAFLSHLQRWRFSSGSFLLYLYSCFTLGCFCNLLLGLTPCILQKNEM
jgi:hypothetical protein